MQKQFYPPYFVGGRIIINTRTVPSTTSLVLKWCTAGGKAVLYRVMPTLGYLGLGYVSGGMYRAVGTRTIALALPPWTKPPDQLPG